MADSMPHARIRFVRRRIVRPVAVALALAVPISGLNSATANPGGSSAAALPGAIPGAAPRPLPQQKAGSADGRDPIEGPSVATERPASLRSRFPLIPPQQPEEPPAGQITIPTQPEQKPVKGYDASTSRELPARRDKYTQAYTNSDGTETTVFSQSPVNYERPDGSWAPIDTTLREDAGSDDWVVTSAPIETRVAPNLAARPVVSMTLDDNHGIGWWVADAQPSDAVFSRNRATFPSFATDADLVLDVLQGGLKETVVLRSKAAPRVFTFPLQLKGLTAELVAGDVVLRDETGKERAVIPAGWMEDSSKTNGLPATNKGVTYSLVTVDGQQALRMELNGAWLDDPARVYPVKVDPSVFDTGTYSSNYAVTVRPNGATIGTDRLDLGYKAGVASAAYLSFGPVSSTLTYHRILQASLAVFPFDAPSCDRLRYMYVHGVKTQWQTTPREDLKYPGPAVTAPLTGANFAYGYIAPGQTTSKCAPRWQTFSMNNAGRDLIQGWVNGQGNYGLALRAMVESDGWAWKGFLGTHTANPPKLFVTHTPYNAKYQVHPLENPTTDAVLQDRPGKIPVTVTNLGAERWDPARYYMTYRVFDENDNRIAGNELQTLLPGDIERTASRTFKVNVGALPGSEAGTDYRVQFTMVDKVTGKVFTDQLVPPGQANITVYNLQPRFTALWPLNGYQSPTLTPNLWANAVDDDSATGVTYKYEICEYPRVNCVYSNGNQYTTAKSWTVPATELRWNKHYLWRAYIRDNDGAITMGPGVNLMTTVPQPVVTSKIANSPLGLSDKPFDPQVGNFTTSATDASTPVAGPELKIARTYNTLDPRRDRALGAGWSSLLDMELIAETNGNAVVTYPDGQQVRFGKDPDGRYVVPPNRKGILGRNATTGVWYLKSAGDIGYTFAANGKLYRVTDANSRDLIFAYNTDGTLATLTSEDSLSRKLSFTWTADKRHVGTVRTDPVDGAALTWSYSYTGDVLTKVCNPQQECVSYESEGGSHYRNSVLDARPESYYRMDEALTDSGATPAAASEIDINLFADYGRYTSVDLGSPGALARSENPAVHFKGAGGPSYLTLPNGQIRRNRDQAIEMWFKTASTYPRPLLGYQSHPITGDSTKGSVPALYVGDDGRLRGQLWNGTAAPITSASAVNDDAWHHVVLTVSGSVQAMYLDGSLVGTKAGAVTHDSLLYNQIGAAYTATGSSWPSWTTDRRAYFEGQIDEVAVYSHALNLGEIASHWTAGKAGADRLSSITSAEGRELTRLTYDSTTERVNRIVDPNGSSTVIGRTFVKGGANSLTREVWAYRDDARILDKYSYDALGGWLLSMDTAVGAGTDEPERAIRNLHRDTQGRLLKIVNEVGSEARFGYDARGNMTQRTTCRYAATDCHTEWTNYHAGSYPELDPRWDKPWQVRDGRSSGATDNRYLNSTSYTAAGDIDHQDTVDGGKVTYTYTDGVQLGPDGKAMPKGLVSKVTGQRGAATSYSYFGNGLLAQTTTPSGLRTAYTYDAIGRKLTEKQISDSYPNGVTTTFGYDKSSRVKTITGPLTTDAVSGAKHQQRVEFEYDRDGRVTKTTATDLQSAAEPRAATMAYDDHGRLIKTVDALSNETNQSYDNEGNVTYRRDANGNEYDYAYTWAGQSYEVLLRDPDGTGDSEPKVIQSFGYDKAGRKARETDAMGRDTLYNYYGDDRLKAVTRKDVPGQTGSFVERSLSYDGAGNLVKEVTDNGKTVTDYVIDAVGRVGKQTVNPGGVSRVTDYTYDLAGHVTKAVMTGAWSNTGLGEAPTARTVEYGYDTAGRKLTEKVYAAADKPLLSSWTYDQRNLALSATQPRGNAYGAVKADFTANFEYDELGRLIRSLSPKVSAEQPGSAPADVRPTVVTGYGEFGLATSAKDELGRVVKTSYDKAGRPVESIAPTYTPPSGGDPITPSVKTEYDAGGRVVATTDPRGNVTRYSYDRRGRQTKVDAPESTNDQRAVSSYTYTDSGSLLSATDPLGARQEWTYDFLDRMITQAQVERKPVAANLVTEYGYNDLGVVTSVKAPSGAITSNVYDSLGQLIRSTDPNGVATELGYDHAGRVVRASDPLGRASRSSYDLVGRLLTTSEHGGAAGTALGTRSYGYDEDGNLLSSTPADGGRASTFAYDALGRMIRQVDPVTVTASVTTSYGYDAAGNRTRYTDGRGNATSYSVNALGLPESVIEPSTAAHPAAADRTWTASYDAAGNPVSMLSPGGVRRNRTFDAAGRLTKEEGTGAEAPTATRELGYDLVGQLSSMSSVDGANSYEYNDRGLLLRADGPSGPERSTYDADGLVTQRVDAAGTADFTYTKGRLTTITDAATRTLHTLGWNGAGDLETLSYGSGRVRMFGYDIYGRQASDVLKNSAGTTVASTTYGYDAEHRVKSKQTTGLAGAGSYDYVYDQLGRLTSWKIGALETGYEWDGASNRTKVTVTGGSGGSSPGSKVSSYDERNRLITDTSAAGAMDYSYSPRGSLLSKTNGSTTESFTFDAFDRLISLADRDYGYDAIDRPVAAGTARMRYAGFSTEMSTDGTQYFGRGPGGELLSLAHGVGTDAVKRLVLSDRREDVVAGFDPADTALAAGVPDSRSYDPFGQPTSNRGLGYRVGFQGDWTDPRSGQVQMSARWYEPSSGAFTSRDTMTYPAGAPASIPNLYAYAAGNPITLSDPTGHNVYTPACDQDEPGWAPPPGDPRLGLNPPRQATGCVPRVPDPPQKDPPQKDPPRKDPPQKDPKDPPKRDPKDPPRKHGDPDEEVDPPSKPKKPVCDAACQWRKKVEERDRAKGHWDEHYAEHHIPLPPGIDDPTCPRGNAMCKGVPGKPSGVISDLEGIDNEGLAGKINGLAGSSGARVIGTLGQASKLCALCMGGSIPLVNDPDISFGGGFRFPTQPVVIPAGAILPLTGILGITVGIAKMVENADFNGSSTSDNSGIAAQPPDPDDPDPDNTSSAGLANKLGEIYPNVTDPRTGAPIPQPGVGLTKVPTNARAPWGRSERGAYIKEWYDRGYSTPKGGWSEYDIHHIRPREYGGTNDFENLVPVLRKVHQEKFNNWWRNY